MDIGRYIPEKPVGGEKLWWNMQNIPSVYLAKMFSTEYTGATFCILHHNFSPSTVFSENVATNFHRNL